MTPGFYYLALLLVFVAVVLVSRRFQQRYATNWHRRAKLGKFVTIYFTVVLVAMGVLNFFNDKPFWPWEAISLGCWLVALGCLIYSWREAKRKATAEPLPVPAPPKPPGVFWQAILILLPVAGLVWFGLYSLRQDRLLAEQEARESGEILAQRVAQAISTEAVQHLRDYREASFSLRANRTADLGLSSWAGGQASAAAAWQRINEWQRANPEIELATLPPTDASSYLETQPEMTPPQPPEWLEQLTAEQQQLWQAAKEAEFVAKDFSAAQAAIEKFIATKPPKGARANAEYLLLLAKTRGMAADEAAAQISEASRSLWGYSSEPTDAGLPVGQLICYQALRRLSDGAGLPESFIRHHTVAWMIQYRASVFSPLLIAETERVVRGTAAEQYAATLKDWWNADAAGRQVMEEFREQHPTNTWHTAPFWVDARLGKFLLVLGDRLATSTNAAAPQRVSYNHLLFPQVVVEKSLAAAVSKAKISLPPYARVEFEMAERKISLSPSPIGGSTNRSLTLLGQADGAWENLPLNQHAYPFRIRVLLASPEILYARQSQRTLLFGALILLAALAALIGLTAAHRAFRRQFQLNTMKSNFVSSVSHELRAPIASVRLLAESLERGKISEPQKQHEYFRFIGQECRRLSALIENVLDFSRIEQGRKQYEFEPTDLSALVAQTVKLMRPYAEERGVRLETSNIQHPASNAQSAEETSEQSVPREFPSPGLTATLSPSEGERDGVRGRVELNLDGRAIQQALVNLIDNAIKHSPKGETVLVELKTRGETFNIQHSTSNIERAGSINNPLSTIHLSVSDHGPGIPASEQEKIFERFYRLGSELRRETQGVGIGLSIVKHVVQAHGGRVRVESEVGKGSRFTIELPVTQQEQTEGTEGKEK